MPPETFMVDGVAHEVGNKDCGACFYGGVLGPCIRCKDGLVHEQLLGHDESSGTTERCDRCGS